MGALLCDRGGDHIAAAQPPPGEWLTTLARPYNPSDSFSCMPAPAAKNWDDHVLHAEEDARGTGFHPPGDSATAQRRDDRHDHPRRGSRLRGALGACGPSRSRWARPISPLHTLTTTSENLKMGSIVFDVGLPHAATCRLFVQLWGGRQGAHSAVRDVAGGTNRRVNEWSKAARGRGRVPGRSRSTFRALR